MTEEPERIAMEAKEEPRPELTREQLVTLFRYVQARWAESEAEITRLQDALNMIVDYMADMVAMPFDRDAVLRAITAQRTQPERFDGTEPINEFIARQRAKRERKE